MLIVAFTDSSGGMHLCACMRKQGMRMPGGQIMRQAALRPGMRTNAHEKSPSVGPGRLQVIGPARN